MKMVGGIHIKKMKLTNGYLDLKISNPLTT